MDLAQKKVFYGLPCLVSHPFQDLSLSQRALSDPVKKKANNYNSLKENQKNYESRKSKELWSQVMVKYKGSLFKY